MASLLRGWWLLIVVMMAGTRARAQVDLLLNGGFEEINTCTEYQSDCGVEAWFYLNEVKAQMLPNEHGKAMLGKNSFAIYYTYKNDASFIPVLGTLLPCRLQAGNAYIFKGMLTARMNPRLIYKPGVAIGEFYYVPRRAFSRNMQPDTIRNLTPVPQSDYYAFEYRFIAKGDERYLTFGSFIIQDTTGGKKDLQGVQTIGLTLDNFALIPEDPAEAVCPAFERIKESIYAFNYRHKQMDYPLYAKGAIDIVLPNNEDQVRTHHVDPPKIITDTLRLTDISFDFNKAVLRPSARQMLKTFFAKTSNERLDSIRVEGHTDSVGSQANNLALSLSRCESVRSWLIEQAGIERIKTRVNPYGKSRPLDTNETPQGRARNRRVELVIFRRSAASQ